MQRRGWLGSSLLVVIVLLATASAGHAQPVAAAASELFFSEYVEGSSNNKALEIYNATGAPVDLAAGGYNVQMYFNGSTSAGLTINLTGTLANGDVFVLAHAGANQTILAQADQTNGSGWFNGDDAVVLRKGTTIIDAIGQIGVDPGAEWGSALTSTADNTLRRKSAISAGDANATDVFDPAVEWDGFAQDTFDGLGRHAGSAPPPPPPAPAVIPIGAVQGVVSDSDNGLTHASPLAGQEVTIQGVIYQKTLARTSSGGANYGFFIQNTPATDDDHPATSDGIFVFMNRFPTLIGGYEPRVGDEVIIKGRVTEFFNLTQLSSASLVRVVRSGVALERELPAFEVNPPDDLDAANRYWERHEGMRAQVPAGSLVVHGRDVFGSTLDGEVWAMRGDHPVAQRQDPYARRVFRDAHPLDNVPEQRFDDGNGYRFIMGSLGIKAAANDTTALIAPARTFDTITNAPVGGVYFSFGKYQIMIEQQLALQTGVDPAGNAPPAPFDRAREYSIANYNVENLYDYRDDPNDGCDFVGNSGCPGVNPPFDYVPASAAEYQAHLQELAAQIVNDLHSPDIILVQEAEDQDICAVAAATLQCGTADNADGRPDTLQELALTIAALGGPPYAAAFDRDGADDRGIVAAFLFRTDRVELLPAAATHPILGSQPQVAYRSAPLAYNGDVQNPKALNAALPADVDRSTGTDGDNVFTRAPQVGLFRIWRDGIGASVFVDVYLINNHFSSGPDRRVGQRREQAAYNAALVAALRAADAEARVVVGGDLNVFLRPDDPFRPGSALFPSDQLAPLYDAGLANLYDVLLQEAPASAYTYVFQGQAQVLDHQFVTAAQRAELRDVRVAHINADWPAAHSDGARGASDHDPLRARYLLLPTLDRLENLVRSYAANGQISGNNTARILLDRLARAQRFAEQGRHDAYRAQLQALIDQVRGWTPRFIVPTAGDALTRETQLLLNER